MIKRILYETLVDTITNSKQVILLYGSRQVGKTTLIREVLANISGQKLEINADLMQYA